MSKRVAIEIGALSFSTKDAATKHFQGILYRYQVGEIIPDPDHTELGWLLERHSEAADKIGTGVKNFSVRDALYGTRCFEVIRVDGKRTDFSFKNCIDGKGPSPQAQVMAALRAEVTSDILDKKREWFTKHGDSEGKVECALTGVRVSFEDAHADHASPYSFGALAVTFLAARGIEPSLALVTPPADNQYQPTLADRALAQEWVAYHHKLAVIRVVAKGANLARAHESKVKKKDRQLDMSSGS